MCCAGASVCLLLLQNCFARALQLENQMAAQVVQLCALCVWAAGPLITYAPCPCALLIRVHVSRTGQVSRVAQVSTGAS